MENKLHFPNDLRVMPNTKAKQFLGPIIDHGWEYVKQIEEDRVSEAITNFCIRNPNHF